MARPLPCSFLLVGLLALAASAAVCERTSAIYPLREVRAGQRATAKSVFRGTRIESFHLEVIGVLQKYDGTRSVILARVLDGPVVERKSGVIGGMSGSPVYIDGRLAGAIALTWPWSKEPIAGITPIKEMLAAWEETPTAKDDPGSEGGGGPGQPLKVEGVAINRVHVSPGPSATPDPPGVMTLVPLGGFVQVSGFNSRGIDRLSEQLEPYGLAVIAGPAGGEAGMRPPLVPGACLGVKLIGGDFDMTVLGTVTLTEGGRLLGFGHPLFQRGNVDLPMTGGYVYDILPSLYVSNKMMGPTEVVGRIFSDHQSAVAGEVGPAADLLPVTIEVVDHDSGRSREFEVEVVRLRDLMPGFVGSAVMTAVDETRGRIARGTVQVSVEFEVEGRPPILREELSYSGLDAASAAMPAVVAPLVTFTDSPFGKLRPDRVRVRVEAKEGRETARIERVTVAQSRARAGEEITLNVRLRPYGEAPVQMPVNVSLPPDLPRGPIRLVVSGGREAEDARGGIGAPRPRPVSLDQLVERYTTREQSSALVVQAALPRKGVSVLGEDLPDLPRSALDVLRATRPTDLRPTPTVLKVVVPTRWALTGRQLLTLQVDSLLSPRRPGPPEPPVEGPPEEDEKEAAVFPSVPPVSLARASAIAPQWVAAGRTPAEREAKKKEDEKPFTRAPEAWVHRDGADYRQAELQGVMVGKDGQISLAPEHTDLAALPADSVWSVVVRDGFSYLGTGSEGVIYRVSPEGEVSSFFTTGELHVHSLARDEDGNIYAGTSPRGKLYRIAPDGSGDLLYDSESTYLWSLLVAPGGIVYAGGGSPARIYKVASDGTAEVLAELSATNVLSLALAEEGDLYAGTADLGVVYRIRPDGSATAVCQVSGDSADALVLDDEGNLYVAASPGGDIYRLPTDGVPELYSEIGQRRIYGLVLSSERELLVAVGSRDMLIRVSADGEPRVVFRSESGLASAITQTDGAVYVGSSAPAVLRRFGPARAATGRLESGVLDAGRTAQWGRVEWIADAPEGTEVAAETRAGDSPIPDDHWSPWVAALDGVVVSPPGRYLQYRVALTTNDPGMTPVVRQIRISHRPQNQPPMCALKSPHSGDRLSEKHTLSWQARDRDKDTLAYEVEISSDLGKTWKQLEGDLREPKYEWDTTEKEDGRYLVRVTASDGLSVPSDPKTGDASVAIWVDNTPPEVGLLPSSLAVDDEGRAKVTGWAYDDLSPLRSIEHRVGDEKWRSLPLAAIEGSSTDVSVVTDVLDVGSHTLEVRAFDAAGNLATDSIPVTVEKSAKDAVEETAEAEAVAEEGAGAAAEEGENGASEEGDETMDELRDESARAAPKDGSEGSE